MTVVVETLCSVEDCGRPVLSRGWCGTHYARWRRLGDPHIDVPVDGMYDARRQSCIIEGCGRERHARGLCATHQIRQVRGVDLHAPIQPRGMSLEQAVRRNVHILGPEECWPAKRLQAEGYGQLHAVDKMWLAHRAAWTAFIGPLPDDIQLHHDCRNRACANPSHLQPVTPAEHVKLHAH